MGLLVFVYRAAHGSDTTNGGVSAKHQSLCVINVEGPFDPSPETPAVMIEDTKYGMKLVPCEQDAAGNWIGRGGMMGGNYAGTSDSRWGEVVGWRTLLPIFDRFE